MPSKKVDYYATYREYNRERINQYLREYRKKNRKALREKARLDRIERKKMGICVHCPNPARVGFFSCEPCGLKFAQRQKQRRLKVTRFIKELLAHPAWNEDTP